MTAQDNTPYYCSPLILMGRLGQDPELKTFGNKHVINASLITVHKYKDNNGNIKREENWHQLQVWDKVAINMHKHCKKGDLLHVQGRPKNTKYKDLETGKNRVTNHVVVEFFQGFNSLTNIEKANKYVSDYNSKDNQDNIKNIITKQPDTKKEEVVEQKDNKKIDIDHDISPF